jgi:hypothetical protein
LSVAEQRETTLIGKNEKAAPSQKTSFKTQCGLRRMPIMGRGRLSSRERLLLEQSCRFFAGNFVSFRRHSGHSVPGTKWVVSSPLGFFFS